MNKLVLFISLKSSISKLFFAKFRDCELIGKQINGTTWVLKQTVSLVLVFHLTFIFLTTATLEFSFSNVKMLIIIGI